MSNIGTKTVRNNHQASGKSQRAPGPAIASAPITSLTLLHQQDAHPDQHSPVHRILHLYRPDDGGSSQHREKNSLGLGENPEKSLFFKLPLRLCECTASTNARSAPQSPPPPTGALLAAGLRQAHREGKQRFRLTRYSLSVSSWTCSPQTGNDAFNV